MEGICPSWGHWGRGSCGLGWVVAVVVAVAPSILCLPHAGLFLRRAEVILGNILKKKGWRYCMAFPAPLMSGTPRLRAVPLAFKNFPCGVLLSQAGCCCVPRGAAVVPQEQPQLPSAKENCSPGFLGVHSDSMRL